MSLVGDLLRNKQIERQLESLELVPGRGGVFEVTVNDELVYSKKATGRHAEAGEVETLIKDKLQ